MPAWLQAIARRTFSADNPLTMAKLRSNYPEAEKMIKEGSLPPPHRKLRRGEVATMLTSTTGAPLTEANRRLHSSSYGALDFADRVDVYAFLRRLQMVGELFTSKHLSPLIRQHLPAVDLEIFVDIRHAITHQTQHEFFIIINRLMKNPVRLNRLYQELKVLKTLVHDLISLYSSKLPAYVAGTINHGILNWYTPAMTFYDGMSGLYNAAPEVVDDVLTSALLTSEEVDNFIAIVDLSALTTVDEALMRQVFSGKRKWFSSAEEKEIVNACLNHSDPKDRTNKNRANEVLKYAKTRSREFLSESNRHRSADKKAKKQTLKVITQAKFPAISSFRDELIRAYSTMTPPIQKLADFISRKLRVLRDLLEGLGG